MLIPRLSLLKVLCVHVSSCLGKKKKGQELEGLKGYRYQYSNLFSEAHLVIKETIF